MEFLKGRIFTDPSLPEVSHTDRLQLYHRLNGDRVVIVDGKQQREHWPNYTRCSIKMSGLKNSDELGGIICDK
jgi:hypothetical protein